MVTPVAYGSLRYHPSRNTPTVGKGVLSSTNGWVNFRLPRWVIFRLPLPFLPSAVLNTIQGTKIHMVTLILAICYALILFIMVYYRFSYELRVTGDNPDAARYVGINFMKVTLIMMLISGGVAGLAGVGEVAGIHHHLSYPLSISSGYGYTAIILAWLAKLNPLLTIFSGIFFAGIVVGRDAIQVSLGLPAATVQIFNGILLFSLIMGDFFLIHRLRIVRREDL